jgi:hypothetical protein
MVAPAHGIPEIPDFSVCRDTYEPQPAVTKVDTNVKESGVNSARDLPHFSGALEDPLYAGSCGTMLSFQNWWERAPLIARVALFVAAIVAMVLGGSAQGYWE